MEGSRNTRCFQPRARSCRRLPELGSLLGQEGERSGGKPRPFKASETVLPKEKAAKILLFLFFESFVPNIYEYLKVLVWQRICILA